MTMLTDNWERLGPQLPAPLTLGPLLKPARDLIAPHLPGGEWKKWDAPYFEPLARDLVNGWLARMERDPWQLDHQTQIPTTLAILESGRAVGMAAWGWEHFPSGWRRVELSIYDPRDWNRGLGTAVLQAWSDWLLALPDTHRLDLRTWSGNERMLRVADKCGFQEDGRLRGAYAWDGRHVDEVICSRIGDAQTAVS
ncbi:GNAT family N-acetyltransferase [Parenemella sanctibonifatiensis]|uniref:N-acetyltransferase domain-containing protein n=1 Tax=Parenemella sanctibonifatiensis TaxID=2016505 RepID=A0A255ERP9_9ACTN|nr:GNAT family protein [Parenemella sanctibonifatiensis]OYN90803.1 hypothetical protein CGZ91_04685 [Parenemella sanctibonifatiensis]